MLHHPMQMEETTLLLAPWKFLHHEVDSIFSSENSNSPNFSSSTSTYNLNLHNLNLFIDGRVDLEY